MERDPVEDGAEREAAAPNPPELPIDWKTKEDRPAGSVAGKSPWGAATPDPALWGEDPAGLRPGEAEWVPPPTAGQKHESAFWRARYDRLKPADPGSVAGARMHLYEVEIEPALSAEAISERGPVQRFTIIADNITDAREEAERRWHDNIRLNTDIQLRSPILIERMGRNMRRTTDAPRGAWWRRIFG